jgi:nucleoside-diphosphate-sugar epimerase
MTGSVVVVGATGFIGSACVAEARRRGIEVVSVAAPRLQHHSDSTPFALKRAAKRILDQRFDALRAKADGACALINAAGRAGAWTAPSPAVTGANSLLPVVLNLLGQEVGVSRFVHVSSAAVLGRASKLSESERLTPFSPYSDTKAWAEAALRELDAEAIRFRPASVHGLGRSVTVSLARLARSPLSSVAGSGERPTPQALVANVASAIVYVATAELSPPAVILHPWEGYTCSSLLTMLGGHPPRHVPVAVASSMVRTLSRTRGLSAHARRLELLWFGQGQQVGWLEAQGWEPDAGAREWRQLASALAGGQYLVGAPRGTL